MLVKFLVFNKNNLTSDLTSVRKTRRMFLFEAVGVFVDDAKEERERERQSY